ncbi:F0F1 ATP synthase subunit A [Fulvivirgaceae bacterium BMA10]|uniref:ATP synthase subunit a n=1 Tax=Splendidivirga corallicola TaxID=3051826 RepID=A0ABT8KTG6_9BACT|nr:F0F1 ATP synthase subunit A [Fulvivirgaceae bacterium BMA10]
MDISRRFRPNKSLKISFLSILIIVLTSNFTVFASGGDGEEFNPGEMIMHHVKDAHEWHFFDIGETQVTLPLPIILYSEKNGFVSFLSSKFHHGETSYKGYKLDHSGHIVAEDGHEFYDISITKNVAALFMGSILMIIIFLSVAKGYRKNEGRAPKGIQSFFEPIIVYVKDEIVKPNVGPKYQRYLPYLLTLFFFIWFGNLFGLLPGAANLTGNIAVTLVLAVFTLIITLVSANKNYWGHIFNPPGVPGPLKIIIIPVEIIGILSKPFSLMLRLFVAITAGHIVILSLIGLVFIFHSWQVGIVSTLIVTFINIIELLVASIQAYVFTLFSAMYIGMAIEEHH